MSERKANVVICGAGIAGVTAAYHLAVRHGVRDILLVDERPPLSLTSDKSTEAYRNWWPGPGDEMVRFMDRSIDLLEELARETDNRFLMNRRGYVFLTADPAQARQMQETAETIAGLGAGPLRVHPGSTPYRPSPGEGYEGQPRGADLLLDEALIQEHYPFISDDAVALLHPRRCGWLSAQQLGMHLMQEAKTHGVQFLPGQLTDVIVENNRVRGVCVAGQQIQTDAFVNAAGPLVGQVAQLLDLELPVFNELHGKISFDDYEAVVPRDAPLMIWNDPVKLLWSEEERVELAADEEMRWLVEPFPAGVHFRPEGGENSAILLALWTYDVEVMEPQWPLQFEPFYPEVILRGLARMVPDLSRYIGRMRNVYVDGGYYCKTRENRPLITPLPVDGAYLIGALSGFGIMASQAAGELLAAHVTGGELPDYAPAFHLSRYDDPRYQALLDGWESGAGQL
ncbi:MAG TPA: FAD-binding oxidoreductase [Candidatus Sulfomarinibacteraceae bacterium]|nr:FAD-binding oxidoreductase [Candidatus Sulfomarinibacteraceae bacterium]